MCILLDKNNIEDPDKLMDSKMQILLTLPTYKSASKITGHIVQCRHISNNLLRIGMDISMNSKDRAVVAHYLSERKREILDELFINFTGLLNYRETKDQYF
jgi:hypothetical protein